MTRLLALVVWKICKVCNRQYLHVSQVKSLRSIGWVHNWEHPQSPLTVELRPLATLQWRPRNPICSCFVNTVYTCITSVVVLEESACPWGSSRTNLQVLVLVLDYQVLVLVLRLQTPRKFSSTACVFETVFVRKLPAQSCIRTIPLSNGV